MSAMLLRAAVQKLPLGPLLPPHMFVACPETAAAATAMLRELPPGSNLAVGCERAGSDVCLVQLGFFRGEEKRKQVLLFQTRGFFFGHATLCRALKNPDTVKLVYEASNDSRDLRKFTGGLVSGMAGRCADVQLAEKKLHSWRPISRNKLQARHGVPTLWTADEDFHKRWPNEELPWNYIKVACDNVLGLHTIWQNQVDEAAKLYESDGDYSVTADIFETAVYSDTEHSIKY